MTSDPLARLIPLGVVIGAHGVRGELRVKLYNPGSDLLAQQRTIALRSGDRVETRRVLERRWHKELLLMTFEHCNDRDVAEQLRGAEVCVPRDALPKLEQGEHYLIDLVGLRAELPDGRSVGVVESVIPYPTADVLCVRSGASVIEVPMLSPYFVEARVEEGLIVVDQLDDLEPASGGKRSS